MKKNLLFFVAVLLVQLHVFAQVTTLDQPDTSSGIGGIANCPDGEIEDCNGNCAPADWIADTFCDDGSFTHNGIAIFFNCEEFDFDGGDCDFLNDCTSWNNPSPTTGWTDFNSFFGGAPQMIGGECPFYEITDYEVWASEAFEIDGFIAGNYYTFSHCNGPGSGSWIPEYIIIAPSGAVDGSGSGNGDGCSITWLATESGTYLIAINEQNNCGISSNVDNGFPAITCNGGIVSGSIYTDLDCNGIFDGDDFPIQGQLVYTTGDVPIGMSNTSGNYYYSGDQSGITSLYLNDVPGFEINDFGITSAMPDSLIALDFALCPNGDVTNLATAVSHIGLPPRPGFMVNYVICASNLGTVVSDAELIFDYSLMPGLSVLFAAGGIDNGSSIIWQIEDIGLFEDICFTVTLQVAVGTSAGTILLPQANVNALPIGTTDVDYSNNSHSFQQLVVAAYDPNDKTVNFPVVNHTEIPDGEGAQLEYLIRFQNTGNFFATFVRVVDELPESLDINTIHMINASHDYELSFPEPNVLEWFFDEIMLPDSTTDEPGSHGFIHFRIKTIAGVQLDDVIENNALIYFDFKEAVVTEYAVTTFMDCSEGSLEIIIPESICAGDEFVLSPNRNDFTEYQWIIDGETTTGSGISAVLNENSVVQLFANHPVCSLSTTLDVTVIQPPTMNVLLGNYVSCNGEMEIEMTCTADFSWYLNEENQGIEDPFVATESGLFNVNCENECGVFNTNIVVEIYDTPETEIVLDENGQLTVNPPGQSYIWYFNGEPIMGANAESYTPTQSGDYSVTVVFDSGCGSTSDVMLVSVSVGEEFASQVIIYPNPANQVLNVVLPFGHWKMALIDVTGKVVLETGEVNSDNISIDTKHLMSGVYLLKGSSTTESFAKTILIQQ